MSYLYNYLCNFFLNWVICDLLLLPFATPDILLSHGGNPHNEPKCGLWLLRTTGPRGTTFSNRFSNHSCVTRSHRNCEWTGINEFHVTFISKMIWYSLLHGIKVVKFDEIFDCRATDGGGFIFWFTRSMKPDRWSGEPCADCYLNFSYVQAPDTFKLIRRNT